MPLDIHPERGHIEELDIMRDDDPQSTRRGTRLILALLAFIAAGAAVSRCEAAPNVANQEQCALVGDMVLVASALQKNDIPLEKRSPIMEDTYREALGGGRGEEVARDHGDRAALRAARRGARHRAAGSRQRRRAGLPSRPRQARSDLRG